MSIEIKSGDSNKLLNVDSGNNLKINFTDQLDMSNYITELSEIDSGQITGEKLIRKNYLTFDYRLRVGYDKAAFQDTFNYNIINTSQYACFTSAQTIFLTGGTLNLNENENGSSLSYSQIQTYKTFHFYDIFPLYLDVKAGFSQSLQNNNIIEFGFGLNVVSGNTAPLNGVFFRAINDQLIGVINNNGVEITGSTLFTPTANTINHYLISQNALRTEFWIDNILRLTLNTSSGNSSTINTNSLPVFFRNYNFGIVGTPNKLKINQFGVTVGDIQNDFSWASTNGTSRNNLIAAPNGQTPGNTANLVNNSAATISQSLSNSTAAYNTLGGDFIFSAQTASETDYILFAYQNPIDINNNYGTNLLITSLRIDTFNGAVVGSTTASGTTFQWAVGVGGTSESLSTVDSDTGGTRKSRIVPIGIQSFPISTRANYMANEVRVRFRSPLLIEPGTYLHLILKVPFASTPSDGQTFRGTVSFKGYFK